MTHRDVTVREAIKRGHEQIAVPARWIMIWGVVLAILLAIMFETFFWLLLIPLSIVFSIAYSSSVTDSWRRWAYANVEDIHQLQRSAELAGLLSLRSAANAHRFTNRFSEDNIFIDDWSIPSETVIYTVNAFSGKRPLLELSENGIGLPPDYFF